MTAWRGWVLALALALGPGAVGAQGATDSVLQQLRSQGYVDFSVSRTLLGRVRVIAEGSDGTVREIVFNPSTGEILRDYIEAAGGSTVPRVLGRPADDRDDDRRGRGRGGDDDEDRRDDDDDDDRDRSDDDD
jgi:hypothetical protein